MRIFSFRMAVFTTALLGLMGCADAFSDHPPLPPIKAATTNVDAFAKSVLGSLQEQSIAETREYCGFIIQTQDGGLATTPISRGTEASCESRPGFAPVVASFHTHGSYAPRYDNEVPSVNDVMNDFEGQTDGYVSTPGGRLWLIDFESRTIRQLCGVGCLPADPNEDPTTAAPVPQSFTLDTLRKRFGET